MRLPMQPQQTDMEFVAGVYERHKGVMYKTALECLSDSTEKDAVVHDAVVRLASHADTLRRLNEKALAVYVASTVRSVALNHERRQQTERRHIVDADFSDLDDLSAGPSYEDLYVEAEAGRDRLHYLREALSEIDETDRELLVGKYLAGESDEDLARRLGIKPESVRMKLTRARRRVRRIIEEKEGGNG